MNKGGGDLSGGRELAEITNRDGRMGSLLQKMIDGVNRLAINTASSATGEVSAPSAPNTVGVKIAGEMAHISISHSDPNLQRGVRYFTEVSTSPSFSQAQGSAIVVDHGSSRTSHPIILPTFGDAGEGGGKTNYYFRSYAQYASSQPSEPYTVGGAGSPTAFQMGGSTAMTLLKGTGSGTGPNNGFSMGQGLGKTVYRGS